MDDFTTNDFTTRTYGTSGLDNRLLFGETSARDRAINLVVGGLTTLLVVVTVISSFLGVASPGHSTSSWLSIVWYRQGDLDPKFRKLIYYMLASIMLLCLCANLYYHDVGRGT
uniref:transmembrane protein 243-like n=1 Tax=Oncorhynchus gorbuscha TaxID=8017 RepID=UPI001EAEF193|nr:transmembrane protein 243-like [Oncorhynchus gorbuscha]